MQQTIYCIKDFMNLDIISLQAAGLLCCSSSPLKSLPFHLFISASEFWEMMVCVHLYRLFKKVEITFMKLGKQNENSNLLWIQRIVDEVAYGVTYCLILRIKT